MKAIQGKNLEIAKTLSPTDLAAAGGYLAENNQMTERECLDQAEMWYDNAEKARTRRVDQHDANVQLGIVAE